MNIANGARTDLGTPRWPLLTFEGEHLVSNFVAVHSWCAFVVVSDDGMDASSLIINIFIV